MMGRSSHSGGDSVLWPWIVATIAIVGVLMWQGGAVRDLVGSVLSSTDETGYAVLSRSVLIERLKSAELEAERTRYQAISYKSLMDEYQALRAEVGQRGEEPFMTARVMARPPKTHYDTLLIAAGVDDGVRVGDWVSAERILIGEVTSVSAGTATVTLLSSPGVERDAVVGEPAAIIILKGQGGASFEAAVPVSVTLAAGDGARDEQTGMLVAIVGSVTHAPTDVAATVRLALPVALSALFEVSITHPRP